MHAGSWEGRVRAWEATRWLLGLQSMPAPPAAGMAGGGRPKPCKAGKAMQGKARQGTAKEAKGKCPKSQGPEPSLGEGWRKGREGKEDHTA